jgi:peptidoglycan/LPS O-acetylase OafA/YrhL
MISASAAVFLAALGLTVGVAAVVYALIHRPARRGEGQ